MRLQIKAKQIYIANKAAKETKEERARTKDEKRKAKRRKKNN